MEDLTLLRRKLTAAMRAEHRLQQRFDTLEWERDVLKPALEDLEQRVLKGEKPRVLDALEA